MPVVQVADSKVWHRRTSRKQYAIWFGWLIGIAIFSYCWQLISDKTIWAFVSDAPKQAADMASRMVPPKWSYMDTLWGPVWDTINIATLGTIIAITIAVPVAFLAARNTTPSTRFVRPVALFIIVSSRSINSLIWALMLSPIERKLRHIDPIQQGLAGYFLNFSFNHKGIYPPSKNLERVFYSRCQLPERQAASVRLFGLNPKKVGWSTRPFLNCRLPVGPART